MNICIVGWYGTETLGDRAILLGISKLINKTFGTCKLFLGSLYPFHSRRCLGEDKTFYMQISPDIEICLFDVLNYNEYNRALDACDLVAMGGGPIMDIDELAIIEYGFIYAQKRRKKNAILGCGLNSLRLPKYKRLAASILTLADAIILRDPLSVEMSAELTAEYGHALKTTPLFLQDPAIIPAGDFLKNSECVNDRSGNLLVNFRDFPAKAYAQGKSCYSEDALVKLVSSLAERFGEVKLAPMHTFFHGGDDRYFLSRIRQRCDCPNIKVIHQPMSVYSLFEEICKAEKCVGMRYHSVVFQTLINGSNAIVDYTEPGKGKISGFLKFIGTDAYNKKYVNIQEREIIIEDFIDNFTNSPSFKVDQAVFEQTESKYVRILTGLA